MVCYHPLHAFPIGLTKDGKTSYKITSNKVKSISFDKSSGHWFFSQDPFKYYNNQYIDIPCGNCVGCRIDYSRDWALRCTLESMYHDSTMFLTLTYDDVHVPHTSYVDNITGQLKDILTLRPDDFTKFMKRLRFHYSKKYGRELRFFACGEYGSQTLRPHYHAIVFGLKLDDLRFIKNSHTGFPIYDSDFVSDCWSLGMVSISESNFDTCAYTARYVMKKQKGKDSDFYDVHNLVPEFVRMSRKPGIGYQYYADNKESIYKYDKIILPDGKIFKPPKYFDKYYMQDCPEKYDSVLSNRISCAVDSDIVKEKLYGDKYVRLSREEVSKKKQLANLIRAL